MRRTSRSFWKAVFRLLWRILEWPHKQHFSWIEIILWLIIIFMFWAIVDRKTGGIFIFKHAGG